MAYPAPAGDVWSGTAHAPLPLDRVHAHLTDERGGGVAVFVGTTRRWTAGRETERLEYEAYGPMADAELHRLADEAARRWGAFRTVALHRLGPVDVREASVAVGATCAHRPDAFEACRWLIDTLKVHVPIWKRERFADGAAAWIHPDSPLADG